MKLAALLLALALAGCTDHIFAQPTCVFLCLTIINDTATTTTTTNPAPPSMD